MPVPLRFESAGDGPERRPRRLRDWWRAVRGVRRCSRCGQEVPRRRGYRLSSRLVYCDAHAWLLLMRRNSP